jgi:PAS domain S-box-containing protein
MKFIKSLRFKVTILVVGVELFIFSCVGFFYIQKFSQEIDNAIIARLLTPGLLMTRGELSFDAVSDRRTMERLLHEPYSEGIVIGIDGHVYFSSDPDRRDTHLDAIDGVILPDPESAAVSADVSDRITPVKDSTGMYLTCLSPLRPNGKFAGYLYLKIGTDVSESEKGKIAFIFAIGSLATISLTAPILSLLLHLMVIRRVNYLIEIFKNFSRGDYTTRAQSLGSDDEIAVLMDGFNGLARRLEDSVLHLRESESRFRILVEHAPEAILVYDVDEKRFVDANRNAEHLFACSSERLMQMAPSELYASIRKENVGLSIDDYAARVVAGEEVVVERVITNAVGQQRLCEMRLVRLPAGNRKLIRASHLDITERKRAEEALRKSEALLNAIQRLTKVGGWEFDVRSGMSFWTEELYRIHEIPRSPGIDHVRESLACYGPQERQIISDAFQRACERGDSYDFEFPFTTYTGKRLWIRTTAQPVYEDGKVVRVVGNLLDITERKRVEDALRLSSERLQLATRVANIGIWDWDVVKNELVWDDSMYQLYGIRKGDFGGAYDAWIRTIHPDDRAHTDGEIQAALRGEREYAPEFRIVRTDGSIRYIKAISQTMKDGEGKPLRMIGTNIDITDRKQAEEEIHKLNQDLEQRVAERTAQLESANKELEAFAYSVSHDLRAPLRHIDGFLDLLKARMIANLDEKSHHYMDTISDAAKRMGILIDDLLAFSRMGRSEMAAVDVDLDALARDIIRECEPETKGRVINWSIGALPVVIGDRAMLRVVLTNLISNAMKFTMKRERADIEIGCLSGSATEIIVFVHDNGAGFDMQYGSKLFGVFQRLHRSDEFEGTGIGLATVRRIIVRHGGRTWAEGKVDNGATFYFSLPHTVSDGTLNNGSIVDGC